MGEVLNAADRFGGHHQAPGFYTITEAAALLRVSTKTIRRRIDARAFPSHKIGGVWRIPADGLHGYLKDARQQ